MQIPKGLLLHQLTSRGGKEGVFQTFMNLYFKDHDRLSGADLKDGWPAYQMPLDKSTLGNQQKFLIINESLFFGNGLQISKGNSYFERF